MKAVRLFIWSTSCVNVKPNKTPTSRGTGIKLFSVWLIDCLVSHLSHSHTISNNKSWWFITFYFQVSENCTTWRWNRSPSVQDFNKIIPCSWIFTSFPASIPIILTVTQMFSTFFICLLLFKRKRLTFVVFQTHKTQIWAALSSLSLLLFCFFSKQHGCWVWLSECFISETCWTLYVKIFIDFFFQCILLHYHFFSWSFIGTNLFLKVL